MIARPQGGSGAAFSVNTTTGNAQGNASPDGDLIGGIVSSIRMGEDGQISLLVGGREIDASLVKTVSEPPLTNTMGTEI